MWFELFPLYQSHFKCNQSSNGDQSEVFLNDIAVSILKVATADEFKVITYIQITIITIIRLSATTCDESC